MGQAWARARAAAPRMCFLWITGRVAKQDAWHGHSGRAARLRGRLTSTE